LKKQFDIFPIIICASIWGITEATFGFLIHLIPINIGFIFWYPLAFYFMNKVYSQTGKPASILYTAIICAGIKLFDLVFPVRIDKIINPSVSIILEGLVMFTAYYVFCGKLKKHPLLFTLAINSAWRILYIIYILFTPHWMVQISPVRGLFPFIQFILIQNIITTAVIYLFIKYSDNIKSINKIKFKVPAIVLSILLLLFNIILQILL